MMILALLAATAFQATPPAAPPAQPNTVSPVVISREADVAKRKAQDPNTVVCKNEPVLGSRMTVKKCATVGEMAMHKFEAQQELTKIQARDGAHP